jgi:hypothetical protein
VPILHYGADGVVVNILRCERREGRFKSGSAPHMSLEPDGKAVVCKTTIAGSVPAGDSSDRAAPAAFKRRRVGRGRWPSGPHHRPKGRGPILLSPPEWARPDNPGRAAANGHALGLRDQSLWSGKPKGDGSTVLTCRA